MTSLLLEFKESWIEFLQEKSLIISASWWNDEGDLSVRMYINNMMNNASIYSLGVSSDEQNYRKTGSALSPRHYGIDLRYKF